MSKSSYNFSTKNSQKPNHYQGGEKKVMKKSLSLLLAIAMVFTMFSGVALAADNGSSDAKAKLIAAGVIQGSLSGDTMDDATWTRQNVTVLLSRLYDVEAEAQATAKGHTFTDVTDPYYDGFITWAVEEGLFTGHSDVRFGYNEDITAQQFAAVLLRALDVEHDYEDAIAAAVEAGILAEELDNDSAVLRGASYDVLVATLDVVDEDGKSLGERLGLEGWVPEVPTIAANATDVFEVTVNFGTEIDTEEAKVSLTRGTRSVSTTTEWVDSKTAILETSSRIGDGDYTVTVDLGDDTELTASFTAEDERIEGLEFVNSDTLAYSRSAVIEVEALNQYNKRTSLATSNFTALVSGQPASNFKKADDGKFVITTDVVAIPGVNQGHGVVPVTVFLTNSNVTISKNFEVGTVPILSKIEAGEVEYPGEQTSLRQKDDVATIPLNFYDQYDNAIVYSHFTAQGGDPNPEVNHTNVNAVLNPYSEHVEVIKSNPAQLTDLFDDNENARVEVELTGQLDKSIDFTVNIYGATTPAHATVSVGYGKVPTKVAFADFNDDLAAGDGEAIIGLIATDAEGEELSAQDIVDSADRFSFTLTGGNANIIETGDDKGKLKLTFTTSPQANQQVFVSAQISQSQVNTFVQTSIRVGAARYPERIAVDSNLAPKAILGAGDDISYEVFDQYGKELEYGDDFSAVPNTNGQDIGYRIAVTVNTSGSGTSVAAKGANNGASGDITFVFSPTQFAEFKEGFDVSTTANQEGRATVRAVIQRQAPNQSFADYSSTLSRTLEAIKSDTELTFSLESIGDLYATDELPGIYSAHAGQGNINTSHYNKELSVIAKDSRGNEVKLPSNMIHDITTSNDTVFFVTGDASAPTGYVLGHESGTATVTAIVYTNAGSTVNLTQTVTVRDDRIVVESISGDKGSAVYNGSQTHAIQLFNELEVKDNYGYEYVESATSSEISGFDDLLRIRYTVNIVQGSGTVSIDSLGNINSVDATVKEFEIIATAPNGKSATVLVENP